MEQCLQGFKGIESANIQAGQRKTDSSDNFQTYFGNRLIHTNNKAKQYREERTIRHRSNDT